MRILSSVPLVPSLVVVTNVLCNAWEDLWLITLKGVEEVPSENADELGVWISWFLLFLSKSDDRCSSEK